MNEVEKLNTERVVAMSKALIAIQIEASATRDDADTGCVGAGRRLERIHRAAQTALDELHVA